MAKNYPKYFPTNQKIDEKLVANRPIVVCAGDSITHGNVGANYVERLEKEFPQLFFMNAGRNSDLTFTLLRRLDNIILQQPDFVTILIGTNDIQATLSEDLRQLYVKNEKIKPTEKPDFEQFKQNYEKIVQTLSSETKAKIALSSIPIMGEDLSNEPNQKADEYSLFIKNLAKKNSFTYLPVREEMKGFLSQFPTERKYDFEATRRLIVISVAKNLFLKKNWDEISTEHGNLLTHDNLHFNEKGGKMIFEKMKSFFNEQLTVNN